MPNLSTYRIDIYPGINDAPLPPNFNGNGRGPNGAYFTQKYNDLIYALSFEAPVVTAFTSTLLATDYEVGTRMLDTPGSVAFSYIMANADNLAYMDLSLNGVKQNVNSLLPGEPHLLTILDVAAAPNTYNDIYTMNWVLLGQDALGDTVGPYTYNVSWKFRTIVGFSDSPFITDYTDPDFDIDLSQSVLYRPLTVTKETTNSPRYLYIFLPAGKGVTSNGYEGYADFKVNGFYAPFELGMSYISRFGVTVRYHVYRLANSTSGSLTVNLS